MLLMAAAIFMLQCVKAETGKKFKNPLEIIAPDIDPVCEGHTAYAKNDEGVIIFSAYCRKCWTPNSASQEDVATAHAIAKVNATLCAMKALKHMVEVNTLSDEP